MPSLADLLSSQDRQRLAERLAELRELEQLAKEIPAQRPPQAAPTLAQLSAATIRNES
jgi:hypothetical protein